MNTIIKEICDSQYSCIEYAPTAFFVFSGEYDWNETPYYIFIELNKDNDNQIKLSDYHYVEHRFISKYTSEFINTLSEWNYQNGYNCSTCIQYECYSEDFNIKILEQMFEHIKNTIRFLENQCDEKVYDTSSIPLTSVGSTYSNTWLLEGHHLIKWKVSNNDILLQLIKYKNTGKPFVDTEEIINSVRYDFNKDDVELIISNTKVTEDTYQQEYPRLPKLLNAIKWYSKGKESIQSVAKAFWHCSMCNASNIGKLGISVRK